MFPPLGDRRLPGSVVVAACRVSSNRGKKFQIFHGFCLERLYGCKIGALASFESLEHGSRLAN